ncbi:long-chain-fatty-acid--CoA ligase [uncultured Sulfitobacter sp.]|uniref:long-chain-fatty-acid--CoA ligase n=1 Tax=uncultured Sulfitobacter sp. TaxID=191468 RepID=UPI002623F7A0|nr:long-chain-fatty-acid--CoA ligase [uncultured Sulfitobacter sp.]
MDRNWTKHYPDGVPAEVDIGQYGSLVDLLEESFSKYTNDNAYILMDKALTYGELDRKSRAVGAYLQSLGLQQGDRVAIMMPNVLQYPVVLAGILRAGFVAVNVNPLYTPRELEHQLSDSGARAIFIIENFAETLDKVIDNTPIEHTVVTGVGDLLGFPKGLVTNFVLRRVRKAIPPFQLPGHIRLGRVLTMGAGMKMTKPAVTADDVAVLQYTGGTTGLSKGAVLLHRTVIANLLSSEAWMKPGLNRRPIEGQLTFICALPLYHVFAFITCSLLSMRSGGVNILIPNPRDMAATIKEIGKYRFHVFPGVNTLFNGLTNHADFAKLDFDQLRIANGGGMAVQEAVARKWLEITGCPICEGYGLSETSSGITCNPTDTDAYSGTIGLPMPNVDIRILDDDGNDVPQGERGEIAIRGPQVMAGYWQRPDATAEVMTPDGYFKSGDIGIMDERGFTKIVDRKKDMILVSGFNVYPNEIEAVAVGCDGVDEAACVGVPDRSSGEAVMLFITKSDPNLTEKDVRAFCMRELTGYKKPRHIRFVDEMPKTNVGKILRRELRDAAIKEMSA